MKNPFLKLDNQLLRKTAEEIPVPKINSKEVRKIIKLMFKIAHGNQGNNKKPIMVGLAAPQIGISKRIILVDTAADGKGGVGDLRVYINPKIIWKSKRKGDWYEGCYSTNRVCGIVSRPISVRIKAQNILPSGGIKEVKEKYQGYVARIFQHEIDHLDGKIFIDHIKDPNKLHWVEENEFGLYRNNEAWRKWPKKYVLKKSISINLN